MTETRVTAPGKLLLFGEHSAVFGYPAVGTAIDRGLTITVTPAKTMSIVIASGAGGGETATRAAAGDITDESARDGVEGIAKAATSPTVPAASLAAFSRFLTDLLPEVPSARITVRSDLPISSGFGSSAALCTAIARWARPGGSPDETWNLAHRIERFFHGTPSGVDTGLTTLGGVKAFRFGAESGGSGGSGGSDGSGGPGKSPGREASGENGGSDGAEDITPLPEAISLPSTLPPLVVGSIPRTRTTRDLVTAVREAMADHPEATRTILDRLGAITTEAIETLRAGGEGCGSADGSNSVADPAGLTRLADLVTEARTHLAALPILSEAVGEILDTGRSAGALAGKPSGAGAGGAFYLICPDRETAGEVLRAVRAVLPPGGVAF